MTFQSEVANRETMITLTIDVDYPFPSRAKGFLFTVLELKTGKDYLKNSKIIAKMINESNRDIKAYWFFTPATTPDRELLSLLDEEKHEVALHVASNPNAELQHLENATNREVRYYTVHGTERLLGQIIWGRKLGQGKAEVPKDFQPKYFYERPPLELDVFCYNNSVEQVVKLAESHIAIGTVLHIHPEWLFQRGTINHRGPVYEALKTILQVDRDLETLAISKKSFIRVARETREFQRNVIPTNKFLEKLEERRIDVFTFVERKWCFTFPRVDRTWAKTEDNIALLKVESYEDWWQGISKKTRNMVRKAEKSGVKTDVVEPDEKLAEGIWRIYNETSIRQDRAFPHYGMPLETVTRNVLAARTEEYTLIGAYLEGELAGFVQLAHGDKIAIIAQILSLQRHADKALNNALIAKAVDVCASRQAGWLMYGRMGNHPSLDNFKQNNGFNKVKLNRYYVPASRKGRIAIGLGLHRELRDVLPQSMKNGLIPIFNWVSRNKTRIRSRAPT